MKKVKNPSFKIKINSILLLLSFSFILVFGIYNYLSFLDTRERSMVSYRQAVYLYAQTMEKDLKAVDGFISNIAVSDYNFLTLAGTTTQLKAHLASHELIKQYAVAFDTYPIVSGLFVYSVGNNTYRDLLDEGYSYEKKEAMRTFMREIAQKGENYYSQRWLVFEIEGVNYLFRILGKEGTYVAAMIDFSRVISTNPTDSTVTMGYATQQGVPLTQTAFIEEHEILLNSDLTTPYSTGNMNRYLVLGEPINGTELNLFFVTTKPRILSYFTEMQSWSVVLSILVLLLVTASLFLLKVFLFSPLVRLIDGIRRDGIPATKKKYSIDEFNQVDEKFSNLKNQISELKIIAYEKEIEKQKAELQYLQLQLRPHFYLNCLKNLYGMAQRQKTEQIQNMIVAVSNHLRYNFQDNLELVPFKEELNHVKNYMAIQQMALILQPVCEVMVDEQLMDFMVPPLLIQTFAENSVKYAMKPSKPLKLTIKAVMLQTDTGSYVDITIQDNGDGFVEEVLADLNYNCKNLYAQKHIGVTNVRHRLQVLYGERAMLAFFNDTEGAVAEILLPFDEKIQGDGEGKGEDGTE